MNRTPEERLIDLKIELPEPLGPIGSYIPFKRSGNQIFFSGQGPMWEKEPMLQGKIGRELTKEQGYEASKLTGLNLLSQIKKAVGSLDKVRSIVNVTGFVNCTDDFMETPFVINGFSDLFIDIFGEKGYHARCAVPVGSLPMNTCVEVQLVIEVDAEA